jgi:hypothetical protein
MTICENPALASFLTDLEPKNKKEAEPSEAAEWDEWPR